jgi:hypothetical protein
VSALSTRPEGIRLTLLDPLKTFRLVPRAAISDVRQSNHVRVSTTAEVLLG